MNQKTFEVIYLSDGKELAETIKADRMSTCAQYAEDILLLDVLKITQVL